MKIAILYICTGRYNQFWNGFYESSERFFLNQVTKHYFVFTDDKSIIQSDKITPIFKEGKGFPHDSLFRFEMFLEVEDELRKYDYIFFFNANMKFVSDINNEILPTMKDDGLLALLHPGYYNKNPRIYSYERNKKSLAYIKRDPKSQYYYYMGALNGGISSEYLKLIRTCANNIKTDYENNIVAIFHDESHLNKYLFNKKCLRLSPSYGYPEGKNLNFEKKILIRDKVKIDTYFNKKGKNIKQEIKRLIKRLHYTLIWK